MTSYAYMRVSTDKQTTDNQREAFKTCDYMIDEYVKELPTSGTTPAMKRPEFSRVLNLLKAGDTFLVTMLDRLGRNTLDVLTTVQMFQKIGVRLRVLQLDAIDLTSPMGKLLLTMLVGVAELERNLIVERTRAGLTRTIAAGTIVGKPSSITPSVYKDMAADKFGHDGENNNDDEKLLTNKAIAEKYGFHLNTVFNVFKKWGKDVVLYEEKYHAAVIQHALSKNTLVADEKRIEHAKNKADLLAAEREEILLKKPAIISHYNKPQIAVISETARVAASLKEITKLSKILS